MTSKSSDLVYYRQRFIDFAKTQKLSIEPLDAFMCIADYYARWVMNSVDGKPMTAKGMFIVGNTGSGKTTLVRTMQKAFSVYPRRRRRISYRSINTLADLHTYDPFWFQSEELFYGKGDYILDDFGKVVNNNIYGNRFDIEPLVESRYQSFLKYGCTTIFTSNLTSFDEVIKIFSDSDVHKGERIKSRICEMCDLVLCNYKDRRLSSIRLMNNDFRYATRG